ncbi:MAG: pyruvate:ferredoxin (flavodoxin) oxidoreductase [Candidatus Eisenbacteria bacterium]
MAKKTRVTVDGNQAAASVAHRTNEVIAIYPITPSSGMGEFADEWSAAGQKNIWGTVPRVVEMQSEGGAAAAVHGALQAGALTTTFTASQGLLLMIPSMYKIAGELTCYCMHVSARTIATHALSIFGDHSDVMACRQTGFALLSSGSVQEAHDFACIGQAATLATRIPLLHFFEGFRISHEVATIEELTDAELREMFPDELVTPHRERAMTPDRPFIRGTAQNPNEFFQNREANNPFYIKCPALVQETMDKFARLTGRSYHLFDYQGDPQAERVIVIMGSGAEAANEAIELMNARGERVGMVRVRLYRPFDAERFVQALPATVRAISVLDRTKEPGAAGEPLYEDVLTALREMEDRGLTPWKPGAAPRVIGGRYGLSSKEFTPAMTKAVYDELAKPEPKNHFTVGIHDDVTHTSLPVPADFDTEPADVVRALFYGLGADGTVGANKNSIKIIGEETGNFAQGYFVYDSKKAGAMTISHLRFGPRPIHSTYLVQQASFIGCHQFGFLDKYDMLDSAAPGAVFLLNAPFGPDEVFDRLPREVQEQIIAKRLKFYVINAYEVAKLTDMGSRINTVMQTCFFAISGVLPREAAIAQIKKTIEKTYSKKGREIVERNFAAVDQTLAHLHEVKVPDRATATRRRPPTVPPQAPDFVRDVTAVILQNKGDALPVSAFPADGTWPSGTTRWEKRNIAQMIPIWNPELCIQCGKCSIICPHATVRMKAYDPGLLANAPAGFRSADYKAPDLRGMKFTIQVAPEDCTGCGLCIEACPAKDKTNPRERALVMQPQMERLEVERGYYEFFEGLPWADRGKVKPETVKGSQMLEPLFEYSSCCAGCGETPYIKLLTQLFGDRAMMSNATGCSSIYGGNLPTTPYAVNADGRGPAWNNSLFEDNAEFGFGFRLALDKHAQQAAELLRPLAGELGETVVTGILEADQSTEAGIHAQRERVAELKKRLPALKKSEARRLLELADYLVKKSVWIVGGDGWAYDIGYGGLDHVLALGQDVNLLVLDTEVYSNTGGQASKATPLGAAAKFASAGKASPKKDLGMMIMNYGNVYVARVALGARDSQTVKAFIEAASYPGPSLIIAYAHCIAHGYDLINGLSQQKLAVDSGLWPLYRYDPRRVAEGKPPLQLDSGEPTIPVKEYMQNEARFRMIEKMNPERYRMLLERAQQVQRERWATYKHMAALTLPQA